jgi:hypothetical protein
MIVMKYQYGFIENVPGGGYSIGHSKLESVYLHVSYSERFPIELFHCTVVKCTSSCTQRNKNFGNVHWNNSETVRKRTHAHTYFFFLRMTDTMTSQNVELSSWDILYKLKNKLRGRSPQANYTDRTTAACRRSYCPPLRVEGVAWSAQRIPTAVNLGFLDRIRYFFIEVAPQLSSRGWVVPVPDPLLLRKSGRAENRTRGL